MHGGSGEERIFLQDAAEDIQVVFGTLELPLYAPGHIVGLESRLQLINQHLGVADAESCRDGDADAQTTFTRLAVAANVIDGFDKDGDIRAILQRVVAFVHHDCRIDLIFWIEGWLNSYKLLISGIGICITADG